MGAGDGPGLTPRRVGQRAGSDTLTLTAAHLPAHKHVATTTTRDQPVDAAGVSTPSAAAVAHNAYISSDAAIGSTGGAGEVDVTPPAVVMTWLIATSGENPNPPRP
jgi:microcystin-dependent protein